jgi:endogenous inhibitor of DNA gyrase (YacG/DUF329 family)
MSKMVKCPRCGKKTDITNNPYRPFCSERCKLIDLGNWLSGNYRIPTRESPADENQTPDPQKDPDRE